MSGMKKKKKCWSVIAVVSWYPFSLACWTLLAYHLAVWTCRLDLFYFTVKILSKWKVIGYNPSWIASGFLSSMIIQCQPLQGKGHPVSLKDWISSIQIYLGYKTENNTRTFPLGSACKSRSRTEKARSLLYCQAILLKENTSQYRQDFFSEMTFLVGRYHFQRSDTLLS